MARKEVVYFWVFAGFIDRIPVYDRSFPADCEYAAKSRVEELKARGKDAFYCKTLPRHFWY